MAGPKQLQEVDRISELEHRFAEHEESDRKLHESIMAVIGSQPSPFANEKSSDAEQHGTGLIGTMHILVAERVHALHEQAKSDAARARFYGYVKVCATIVAIIAGLASIAGALRVFHII